MASSLILLPLLAVILANLPGISRWKRFPLACGLALALWQIIIALFGSSTLWQLPVFPLPFLPGLGLQVTYLTLVMYLAIGAAAASALLVGWHTLEDEHKRFDFLNLVLLAMAGMNGVIAVTDLFSLYVFIEAVGVGSFVLIALHKDADALEGSFKYLVMSAVATLMMLSAIALFMMTAGGTSFAAVAAAGRGETSLLLPLAATLFVAGLFIKSGVVPFHGWLPDAYTSAPGGASVLLAGIVTKTTGVYTLIRLVTSVFGYTPATQTILLLVGALSIVIGAVAALGQSDMKRMLAYSSISQVGYIIIGLGTGTPLGIAGAVFHLLNHALFKTQLFVNAAAVEEQTGTRDMDRLGGLTARMPATGITSVIGLLSTAGVPPLSGFWSKLIIIASLWLAGWHWYALIAVGASVLTLAYMLSLQRRVFFGTIVESCRTVTEARAGLVIPAIALALLSIVFGIAFPFMMNRFILPIAGGW